MQLKTVHTAPWPHCPNKNVFSNRLNLLYDRPHSLRLGGRLFQTCGPAAKRSMGGHCGSVTICIWCMCVGYVRHTHTCKHSIVSDARRQQSWVLLFIARQSHTCIRWCETTAKLISPLFIDYTKQTQPVTSTTLIARIVFIYLQAAVASRCSYTLTLLEWLRIWATKMWPNLVHFWYTRLHSAASANVELTLMTEWNNRWWPIWETTTPHLAVKFVLINNLSLC